MEGKIGDKQLVIFGESYTRVMTADKESVDHFIKEQGNPSNVKTFKNPKFDNLYEVYVKSKVRMFA